MRVSDDPAGEEKSTSAWPWTELELTCRVWLGGQMKKKVWIQHMIFGSVEIDPLIANCCVVCAFVHTPAQRCFNYFKAGSWWASWS